MALGLQLGRVLLVLVAHLVHVFVPEQGVVVEIHLGVEGDNLAGAGHHHGIDLHQGGVHLGEGAVHRR